MKCRFWPALFGMNLHLGQDCYNNRSLYLLSITGTKAMAYFSRGFQRSIRIDQELLHDALVSKGPSYLFLYFGFAAQSETLLNLIASYFHLWEFTNCG